jgi:hypothetical protein
MRALRHFVLIIGGWKFEDWHLYRWCGHRSARNPTIAWYDWDRVA